MTYKIKEIFLSVQGEGSHLGRPAIFVRFSGCNMQCEFCDTDHDSGNEFEVDQVCAAIVECCQTRHISSKALACVVTGGEPLLQLDEVLVSKLRGLDLELHLETNGSLDAERQASTRGVDVLSVLSNFEEITVSPKVSPVSGLLMGRANTVKVLIPFPARFSEGDLSVALSKTTEWLKTKIAQPQTPSGGIVGWEWKNNVNEALAFSLKRKQLFGETWRVVPQTHIIMRVR